MWEDVEKLLIPVIEAAEPIPNRDLFGLNESIRKLELALSVLDKELGK